MNEFNINLKPNKAFISCQLDMSVTQLKEFIEQTKKENKDVVSLGVFYDLSEVDLHTLQENNTLTVKFKNRGK